MPEPSLLERLKQRKIIQWALAYLAGAFVVFQLLDALETPLSLTPTIQRGFLAVVVVGFFITLVLAWYHGEKGRQRVSGPELLMVAALLVVAGVALTALGRSGGRTPVASSRAGDDRPGIAVLVCDNISPNPEDAYYADGIHEEILVRLQKISSLFSVGRASVLGYRETRPRPMEIARELQVEFIGECSVRKVENQIRLTFQLLDGETGGQLWADNYDRDLTAGNLLEIESEVAQQVAREVGAMLTPEERDRIDNEYTEDLDALEAYMLGRHHLDRRDEPREAFSEAVRYFQAAIETDPDLAVAHAALARAYAIMMAWGLRDPRETLPQVERWARSALAIDTTVAEAHLIMASLNLRRDRDWEEAERGMLRALELSPNDPGAHLGYAELLLAQGRIEEAREYRRIATALDPLSSLTLQGQARSVFYSRRYEEADELVEVLLTRAPENSSARWSLAQSYLFGGRPEQVTRLYPDSRLFGGRPEQVTPIYPDSPTDTAGMSPEAHAWRAVALSLLGEADRAKSEIEEAVSDWGDQYFEPLQVWQVYAALGERDEAFYWAERGIEVESYNARFLGVTPFADLLRDDPRYQVILDRIGLGHLKARFDSLAAARPWGGT
jgi:serine/threonine-protein kinase